MYFSLSNSAMKFLLPLCFGLAILGLTMPCQAQLSIGSIPAPVKISGAQGGKVAGGNWSSAEIKGKVYTVMYVDPDEKDLNEHVERALKSENFPRDKYGSMAIVNSAATWKPDAVIRMILKSKQKSKIFLILENSFRFFPIAHNTADFRIFPWRRPLLK